MVAAYAALVSLTHTIDHMLNPPPHHQFNFDCDQINCLLKKADFLIDNFLKSHSSNGGDHKEIEDLETRISVASEGAEYMIEDNVMNHILAGSSDVERVETSKSNILLSEGVRTTIQEFHSIEEELVKRKKYVQAKISVKKASSSSRLLPIGENIMVGFEDHVNEIVASLFSNESNIKIHSVVGMGGIGKTTLATNVYNNTHISEYFRIRAWFTVSQEYTEKEIIHGLLHQINDTYRNSHDMNADEIGDKLYKTLFGRKYLIVIDDMWDIKAWDMLKRFLPDNNNASRILVTTRLLRLAINIRSCSPYRVNLLDEEQSWELLRQKIFVDGRCPVELEGIGKCISKKCRGLPLALVAIAGVLANLKTENWKYVEEDVTSAVNNEDDEFCIKILLLSYNHLPMYLKPCFLYFVVFPEDFDIKMSRLVRLWIAEEFIRKREHKSLEEIGEEYLEDLIDKNLISVRCRSITREVTNCHIHDLLSDLCRREAQKDNFITGKQYNDLDILSDTKIRPTCLSINIGKWK